MSKGKAHPDQPVSSLDAVTPVPPALPQNRARPFPTPELAKAYTTPAPPAYSAPDPKWELPASETVPYCGECPKWKRAHPLAPFGQCLAAMRFLAAPLYTPDMGACSWTMEQREKAR